LKCYLRRSECLPTCPISNHRLPGSDLPRMPPSRGAAIVLSPACSPPAGEAGEAECRERGVRRIHSPGGTVEVLSSRSCRTHTSPIEYIASSARRIEPGSFLPRCSHGSGRSWRALLAQTELCLSRSAALTIMPMSCSLFLPLCLWRRRCSSSRRDRRNGATEISAVDCSSGRRGILRRVSVRRWSRRRKHIFAINESIIEGSDSRRSGECSWRETGSPRRENESARPGIPLRFMPG
jgi:hypothetical protein